jgi:hypothetical protein
MSLVSPHFPTRIAQDDKRPSAGFRALPTIAVNPVFFGPVPKWAINTPYTALIFINKLREFLGVL